MGGACGAMRRDGSRGLRREATCVTGIVGRGDGPAECWRHACWDDREEKGFWHIARVRTIRIFFLEIPGDVRRRHGVWAFPYDTVLIEDGESSHSNNISEIMTSGNSRAFMPGPMPGRGAMEPGISSAKSGLAMRGGLPGPLPT